MGILSVKESSLEEVANEIRAKTGETSKLEFPNGFIDGISATYEAGQKSEYNRFWDSFQKNGERVDFYAGFRGWRSSCFKPKHDIQTNSGYQMFAFFTADEGEAAMDLVERCEQCDINLDFSKSESFQYLFWQAQISHVGILDTRNSKRVDQVFQDNTHIEKIDKIILKEDGTQTFLRAFQPCSSLKEVTIEGVIGQDFNAQWSTLLTLESLKSALIALKDYTGTEEEFSKTIYLSAESKELLASAGAIFEDNTLTAEEYVYRKKWNY